MSIQKELSVKLPNSPGSLSRVAQILADERVNLLAMSVDLSGTLRMVVDNPLHAGATLRDKNFQVEERDVLYATLPNEPGSLARTVRLIAEAGINLEYAYASGIDTVPMVGVVIGTADVLRASAAAGI